MTTVLLIGDAPDYAKTMRTGMPDAEYVTVTPGGEPLLDTFDPDDTVLVLTPAAYDDDETILVDHDWLERMQTLVLDRLARRVAADARARKVRLSEFRIKVMAVDAWQLSGNSAVVEAHLYAQLAKRTR